MAAFDQVVRHWPEPEAGKEPKAYSNQFYVREILEYLQRGHSLLHPQCRCIHGFEVTRCTELGISMPRQRGHIDDKSSIRDGICKLDRKREARTVAELEQEIAVGDLFFIETKAEKLIQSLVNNAKIVTTQTPQGELTFAFRATFESVTSKQELLQLINRSPLGLKEPTEKDTYNGVKKDLKELEDEGEIFVVPFDERESEEKELKNLVLFPRHKRCEFPLDEDVKALWRDNGPRGTRVSVTEQEREMEKVGLIPTKQEKPEKRVLGKRKGGPGSRKRRTKKFDKHAHLKLGVAAK